MDGAFLTHIVGWVLGALALVTTVIAVGALMALGKQDYSSH